MHTDPYDIRMPVAGPVTTILLARWIVPDGGPVKKGEPICELETDKATTELPAPITVVLRHVAAAGSAIAPGKCIARITPDSGPGLPSD